MTEVIVILNLQQQGYTIEKKQQQQRPDISNFDEKNEKFVKLKFDQVSPLVCPENDIVLSENCDEDFD